jgi:hypothetical protein
LKHGSILSDIYPKSRVSSQRKSTLEEENQQLRKELAEKLRTENADLKKRLGR